MQFARRVSAWQGGLLEWEVLGIGGLKEGRGRLWALGELLGMVGFQASKYLFGFGRCIDRPDAF